MPRFAMTSLMCLAAFLLFTPAQAQDTASDRTPPRVSSLLIQPAELARQLEDPQLRILDVRSANDYEAGHIPGAVRVDVGRWVAQANVPHGFHDAQAWSKLVGQLGIARDTRVVVYGERLTDAARIWWSLKYAGVSRALLLDGGWPIWTAEMGKAETETRTIAPTSFEPSFQSQRLMEIDELKGKLSSQELVILDTRSLGEFTGQIARGARGGRIPGAAHLEWVELLKEDGRMKSPTELSALFQQRGIDSTVMACTY